MLASSYSDATKDPFNLSHEKNENWCFYYTVGLSLQVHPGSIGQQEGRHKIMALRKLTPSVRLLAASRMLVRNVDNSLFLQLIFLK